MDALEIPAIQPMRYIYRELQTERVLSIIMQCSS
jgi:hypothetical protein